MDRDKRSILVSCKYALKTNKVGTILLNPVKLLIALIAICNIISLLIYLPFNLF